jgi:hypothetical protein
MSSDADSLETNMASGPAGVNRVTSSLPDKVVLSSGLLTDSSLSLVASNEPSPRSVDVDELRVLQTCLTRWRTEVEQDVKGNGFYLDLLIGNSGRFYCGKDIMLRAFVRKRVC